MPKKEFIIKEHFLLPIFLKRRNSINQLPNSFFVFVDEVTKNSEKFRKQLPVDLLEKYERAFISCWHHKEWIRLKGKQNRNINTYEAFYFEIKNLSSEYEKNEKQKQIDIQKAIKNIS